MKEIDLKCTIVTPMFAGNAFQKPEIRVPEIKSAMRFWWRAMHATSSINMMKEEEAKIFGGSFNNGIKQITLRSTFDIDVNSNIQECRKNFIEDSDDRESDRELLGILSYLSYGRWEFKKGFANGYLPAGSPFVLRFIYDNENQLNLIKELIWLTGTISGIGGKCRNGFGKFFLEEENYSDRDIISYLEIKKTGELQSFTSFSKDIEVFQTTEPEETWQKSMAKIGYAYKQARKDLSDDHFSGEKRKYIGSPLIIKNNTVSDLERHSKSYFLTVIKEAEDAFHGIILFMPYDYLKNSENGQKFISVEKIPFHNAKYQAVHKEFNALLSDNPSLSVVL